MIKVSIHKEGIAILNVYKHIKQKLIEVKEKIDKESKIKILIGEIHTLLSTINRKIRVKSIRILKTQTIV